MLLRILILFTLLFSSHKLLAKEITIATDPWCPYNCPENKDGGIVVEILTHIAKKRGDTVKVKYLPWARAISDLRAGKSTTFGSANPADASDLIYATTATIDMKNTTFKRKEDSWTYKTPASFEEGILAVIRNYSYGPDVDKYITKNQKKGGKVWLSSGDEALDNNLRMLAAKRVRFTIEDLYVGKARIEKLGLEGKLVVDQTVNKVPLFFGFSPKNPDGKEYADFVSKELLKMRKNGELLKIFKKYKMDCDYCE